ncbi:MAG TPA: thiamine pyrophosphate-binding protein [candidate division Zixibacteria bacterium]|nr:thiamine pyrophosphate-binding protein [candidate division Zixibacteria bacterium]
MAARYGSDLIVDLLKLLGIEYVALNPGSSFRGIHDSLVNYESGRRANPEIVLCCHEEIAVAVAHGYAKAAGKPMAAIVHDVVGLQHASMAIYNAWCDRTPILVMGGTGPMNTSKRRPWIDWIHTALVQGNLVRDFVKWDDQPVGVESIPLSMMRAHRIATSDPPGPVYICFDVTDQETLLEKEIALPDPGRHRPPAPLQAEAGAIREAARLLSQAQKPVILADYVGRNNDAVVSLVELAELLSIPVVDLGARLNFPNTHPLNLTGRNRELVAEADVILGLDVTDLFGALVRQDPATRAAVPATRPGCKVIHVTLADISMRGWTSDFQELAPVDLPIVANTAVFLPALIEEIHREGKFSRSAVEERGKALAAQHREIRARWQSELKRRWDERPISPPRLAHEVWEAVKTESWLLVAGGFRGWPQRLWDWNRPGLYLGGYGGGGLGYGPGASVGAAIPYRGTDTICVNLQRDGELLYTSSALWTAANAGVPLLTVMTNNRTYYNDEEHQEKIAIARGRPPENKVVGMRMEKPPVDFAGLARSLGVAGEGPVTEPDQIRPALDRAIRIIKEEKRPALVDVFIQNV